MTDSKRFRTSPMLSSFCTSSASATTARKFEMCCSSVAMAVRSSSAYICRAVCVLLLATSNESKTLPSANRRSRKSLVDFPTTTRPRSSTNCGCSTLISTPPIAKEEEGPPAVTTLLKLCESTSLFSISFHRVVRQGVFCRAKCSKSRSSACTFRLCSGNVPRSS